MLASRSGLVTVTGGKWTTYRAMAEDVLQKCFDTGAAASQGSWHYRSAAAGRIPCRPVQHSINDAPGIHLYGAEAAAVAALPGSAKELGGGLTEAMVRFAARFEYARTVEDVLARRSRLLFLDARKAIDMAPAVADILQEDLGIDPQLPCLLGIGATVCAQKYADKRLTRRFQLCNNRRLRVKSAEVLPSGKRSRNGLRCGRRAQD